MGNSKEAWEGVNPKLEWAPIGLHEIQGFQLKTKRPNVSLSILLAMVKFCHEVESI